MTVLFMSWLIRLFVLTIPLALGTLAFAAPPPGFDELIEALRKEVGVPGMAISIVERGKVTLAKGSAA